ncbi:serine/threonine-protein kinase [uncultured Gemmiger sp.]|uniref:serine/threonine-protein kinase n=1 Tax=Gemmiger sp. TaxID=2049027 RepID=UPI00265DF4E1|nr:serine/threonine-protein kinase [uncultured Gemmiger sp.]
MDTNTFNNLISQTWPDLHAASTLGGGTFGTVYACTKTDAVTGVTQKEAVKVVRVDFTPEDRANAEEEGIPFADYYRAVKEKRLQEIRWMVALKSPHIVHINGYTAIEEPDLSALYILIRMDRLTTLDQLRPAHLNDTPEQAAALAEKVALDICDALRVCHQNGVLHRDIKPANILCSDAGDFYLGDFGISKGTAQQASMTSSGTLEYAPREVMTGQYDHRADLYSLGLVLYALVNHWRGPFLPAYPAPITPGDRNQAQYARLNGTPLPPPDNCPAALWAAIARLCAFAPEERFDSAEAVLAALCDPGTPAPAPAPHRAHPNLPRIRHPRRLATVVLVSAVAVGVGVGLYRRQQMAAPDISLGAGRDSTDTALAQASDLLQGNENFMTAHNLQFCSDRNVTIPGGALVYLTDPAKIESDYPGYTTAADADVEAGDLTLTFTDVTAEDNDDGTVTYTIQLTERADITQRRTQDAPIYGVGARFATVLPFDAATGQVFPSLTEDWTPHRAYTVQMTATVDGHTYEMPINRDTTWQMESADGDVAATEQVDDLPGYGMPGLILRAAYVKQQTIMIKAPAASDLGLLVCTVPYDGYTEGDYENTPPVQALADTPGFAGYDKYWYFDLNELTKE